MHNLQETTFVYTSTLDNFCLQSEMTYATDDNFQSNLFLLFSKILQIYKIYKILQIYLACDSPIKS